MDLQLFSIAQAPRHLPAWDLILDDLGRPSAERIARALDVGVSTVYRWNSARSAPRMACLALFWLTRWGRSEIDCRATNDAMMAVGLARSLHQERAGLRGRTVQLAAERDRLRALLERALFSAGQPHGIGTSALPTHTDTAPGDWRVAAVLALAGLQAPQHGPAATPVQAQAPEPREPAQPLPTTPLPQLEPALLDPCGVDPGSPAETPPGARSARCRAPAHRPPPPPSAPPEAAPSLPSSSLPCSQSDAIMASSAEGVSHLLELRQAQGRPHEPAGALAPGGALRAPSRGQDARVAAAGAFEGSNPADQGAKRLRRRAIDGTREAAGRPAGAPGPALRAEPATRPERPLPGAQPQPPAPRAPSAAEGACAAFSAITTALTTRRTRS